LGVYSVLSVQVLRRYIQYTISGGLSFFSIGGLFAVRQSVFGGFGYRDKYFGILVAASYLPLSAAYSFSFSTSCVLLVESTYFSLIAHPRLRFFLLSSRFGLSFVLSVVFSRLFSSGVLLFRLKMRFQSSFQSWDWWHLAMLRLWDCSFGHVIVWHMLRACVTLAAVRLQVSDITHDVVETPSYMYVFGTL